MIYFNWPPGPFLATQYDKEPGGAGFGARDNLTDQLNEIAGHFRRQRNVALHR